MKGIKTIRILLHVKEGCVIRNCELLVVDVDNMTTLHEILSAQKSRTNSLSSPRKRSRLLMMSLVARFDWTNVHEC